MLPRMREALTTGLISWSVAELLARVATTENEALWLERSRTATVRELRKLLADQVEPALAAEHGDDEPTRFLSFTATRDEAWLFEGVRRLITHLDGTTTADAHAQALLAEGFSTLLQCAPEHRRAELYELQPLLDVISTERAEHAQWCAERAGWRDEAEARARPQLKCLEEPSPARIEEQALPRAADELDREIRGSCADLAQRDLMLGLAMDRARANVLWLRLGFTSEAHYVRERIGLSLSSLKAKRALAVRAVDMPAIAAALSGGIIGYEAAYLVSRVATPVTVEAWVARARERTVKHLREEVEAAELFGRFGLGREVWPPDDATMTEFFELERRIVSGEVFEQVANDVQTSGPPALRSNPTSVSLRASVTFRLRVSADTYRFWRALERVFLRLRPLLGAPGVTFLRFLCETFCATWLPAVKHAHLTDTGKEPAYFEVYRRDRFRCTSPVCTRRDITPHHLVFRAAGGGDEAENLTSLCVWCHLHGIHEGRLGAEPPASRIHWRVGRRATLRVEGRVRLSA